MKQHRMSYDSKSFKQAVTQFEILLKSKQELEEKKDLQPFFKDNPVLILEMAGLADMSIIDIDEYESEFDLWGDLITDFAFGNGKTNTYCLIEFEDATRYSLFQKSPKNFPKFSSRLECGMSQIGDWFWRIDSVKNSADDIKRRFASDHPKISAILIIGRSEFLDDDSKRQRFQWRKEKIVIDSKKIKIITYDQLLDFYKTIIQIREKEGKLFDID